MRIGGEFNAPQTAICLIHGTGHLEMHATCMGSLGPLNVGSRDCVTWSKYTTATDCKSLMLCFCGECDIEMCCHCEIRCAEVLR
jgi:hypothetical protein